MPSRRFIAARFGLALGVTLLLSLFGSAAAQTGPYFPGRHDWQRRSPDAVGMDAAKIDQAIAIHEENESTSPRDLRKAHDLTFGREAYGEPLGPFQERGDPTGIIVRKGYIVAEWGEPRRPDMTFSVTKSFLSSIVGVALDRGLIQDINHPVKAYVPGEHFAAGRNARITWDHLLRQTSDWEGTLWGKPDWADRPPKDVSFEKHMQRVHSEPGTTWKYNDVRVNLLAFAAINVWRRPLQQVLKEYIMDPIDASTTWRWHGYENAWLNLDGVMMQVPTGGGHWGGGMVISAEDMARFGLLGLHRGRWNGKQVLSEQWVKWALTPTAQNTGYGFMNWYLNTGRKLLPSAPENVFCHMGNGTNAICVDPDLDLVMVVRWIGAGEKGDALDRFIARVRDSVKQR